MRELSVEPDAEAELLAATRWYEEQEPGLGAALLAEVTAALGELRRDERPGLAIPGVRRAMGARRSLLERFPYAIVFLERAEIVHVLAFAHHKRRPGYWRSRR
jgi:hypothetical protein